MKVMIVGAGKKAREILDRLGHSWIVTLVDRDREKLELMGKRYDQVAETVEGDASSNLILSKAGLEEQKFVAAVTNRDDVNLEVCRMAKEEGVKQIIAVASDSRNVKKFVDLGVRVVSDSFLVAREVQLYFENPQISVSTIGKGKGGCGEKNGGTRIKKLDDSRHPERG
jgi:Trk K+ transport system NAD-binding subunit